MFATNLCTFLNFLGSEGLDNPINKSIKEKGKYKDIENPMKFKREVVTYQ